MIDVGMFLYFVPPYFASGEKNINHKKRLMLVINKNIKDNTLTLINISKVLGKPNSLTYPFNILIRNYYPPLPTLSFAKMNDNYIIENFKGLEKFLYKKGQKINKKEFTNIMNRYSKYLKNNKVEKISITKNEFLKEN